MLVTFLWNLHFLDIFSKNTEISNFKKIRPLGGELFYADGRTDRHDEANNRFRNFANVPNKHSFLDRLLNIVLNKYHCFRKIMYRVRY